MNRILLVTLDASLVPFYFPSSVFAQSKPLKEVRVPYALGGSTGFFWVAQRSGSFEKYGLKVLPIFHARRPRGGAGADLARCHDAPAGKFRSHPRLGTGRQRSRRSRRHRQQTGLRFGEQPRHQEARRSQRQRKSPSASWARAPISSLVMPCASSG